MDVIFAIGPTQAYATAKATNIIPIVFIGGGDLVELRLTKSYPHPGGNVTGLTLVALELAAKRIELLKEAIPAAVLRCRSDTVGTRSASPSFRAWGYKRGECSAPYILAGGWT